MSWIYGRRWSRLHREQRDDVLQTVSTRMLERAPSIRASLEAIYPGLTPGPRGDEALGRYVSTMVRNLRCDEKRGRERISLDDLPPAVLGASLPPPLEERIDARSVWQLLDAVWSEIAAGPGTTAGALEQLRRLTFEPVTMDDLVAEAAGEGESFTTVRDRLYMRHRRARHALCRAIRQRVEAGSTSEELGAAACEWVQQVLRRRRAKRPEPEPGPAPARTAG